MPDLLVSTTLLLVLGAGLLAADAGRIGRNPFLALLAIGLVLFALVARVGTAVGPLAILAGLFVDAGFGLLAVALVLAARRRASGRAFASAGASLLMGYGLVLALRAVTPAVETTLLVELGPDDHPEEIAPLLRAASATAIPAFPRVTPTVDADLAAVLLVAVPERHADGLAHALRADRENVDHVAVNGSVTLNLPEATAPPAGKSAPLADDPLAAAQWALDAARVHAAHARLRDVIPVRRAVVAVLDTGIDGAHPDLIGAFRSTGVATDAHGHGTHCAGIAGAATNNGVGIASLNWQGRFVEVIAYRALPANGAGTHAQIAAAIVDAVLDGADVLSMSLGEQGRAAPKVIRDALGLAARRGVLVVASAGNAGRDGRDHMPSNVPGVVAVAALAPDLTRAPFSNTVGGLERALAAPGADVLSLAPGGDYVRRSGTSMAAPFVAGLAGVLRALDPSLTPDELYLLLRDTGRTVADGDAVGPLVDADGAVRRVLARRDAP